MVSISRELDVQSILEAALSRPFKTLFVGWLVYITYKLFVKSVLFPSPYRNLPSPERASYLLGQRVVEAKGLAYTDTDGIEQSVSGPGEVCKHYCRSLNTSVFVFPEPFGGETIFIADPYALNAIISDIDKFQSDILRTSIIKFIVGNGIVAQYGDAHRKQRKLMAPAFTPSHLKNLVPIFTKYGQIMCAKIRKQLDATDKKHQKGNGGGEGEDGGTASIDFAEYLDCAMLDIIGMAGFGYNCSALEKGRDGSELSSAFNSVNQAAIDFGLDRAIHLGLSALLYPPASTWPISDANRRIAKVNRVMDRISMEIVQDAKRDQLLLAKSGDNSTVVDDELEDKKDLLSLLVKSNLKVGASDQMTDKEIGGQIQTFMFAGYETSSVTTSWALYYLSRHLDVQQRLRKIISETMHERKGVTLEDLSPEDLDYDDLWSDQLKYLDHVLSETLRLCPPVPGNDREATTDVVLPLMTPITTKDGRKIHQLHLKKGSRVTIGIKSVNYDPRFFGDDADEFRPERWDNLPDLHSKAKFPPYGMYSFIGGPKSCIGSKFALTEMKALLILILKNFQVSPQPGLDIKPHQALIVRPRVQQESGGGAAGMPLRVRKL